MSTIMMPDRTNPILERVQTAQGEMLVRAHEDGAGEMVLETMVGCQCDDCVGTSLVRVDPSIIADQDIQRLRAMLESRR